MYLRNYNPLNCDLIKRIFTRRIAEKTRNNFININPGNNNEKIIKGIIRNYEWTLNDFFLYFNFFPFISMIAVFFDVGNMYEATINSI